ncbi:hypothetical protein PPERSA_03402 [Pseudocohnilembus persalinus]|uniref:Transmembrane protein n=1 Tax=Pseudocohnilembus persalinus TaxID=266149 RepID=A0A0V0QBR5_PSEPJ|nr:hypothetical protein PPERSA_03402 [Pseudocohnilembus persalinus]|eukprot:KRW99601.1 hypothetical protein PPERSA_03402 [Pseudocohnilembus persalinus]
MITRNIIQKSLINKQIAKFAGGDIRHKFSNEITDEELKQQDKFLVQYPEEQERHTTLYSFFSAIPFFQTSTWQNFFSKSFETSTVEQRNDFFRPPKVHENSVFVYQSKQLSNTVRKARSQEIIMFGAGLVCLTSPVFYVAFLVPAYYLWGNAYFYELSRRLVTRMDLLPHLEMISVQRVGAGGMLYNKLYRIQDLEYVTFQQVEDQENYFWALCKHVLDKHLIFKCKSTGEYLLFDQQGHWDHQGLNHALLN